MRYFKFRISIPDETLLIPKLIIAGNDFYVTCYFSKREFKKLKNLGYKIEIV
jgi:hypothetical protein